MIVGLWGNLVFCGCWDHKCIVRAWLVINGLESFPWVSNHLPSISAGICGDSWHIYSLLLFQYSLEEPQSTALGFKKCWWSAFGFYWFSVPWWVRCSVLDLCLSLTPSDRWASGFRFYLQCLPLTAHFILLKGWDGLVTFLFLNSPLLFSFVGIKRNVTSWLLKGLFKEGCSVLPLVETYSHPRTCYFCFRDVTLKLCRCAECPAVINSEIWIMK